MPTSSAGDVLDPLSLLVQLGPLALLVGVVVRELFRRACLKRRLAAAILSTAAMSGWVVSDFAPGSGTLLPTALYLGVLVGSLWDAILPPRTPDR